MRAIASTRRLGLATVAFALLAVPALAEGTAAQRTACMGDAFRLCGSEIPSATRVKACLIRERAKASEACQAVMAAGLQQELAANASARQVR